MALGRELGCLLGVVLGSSLPPVGGSLGVELGLPALEGFAEASCEGAAVGFLEGNWDGVADCMRDGRVE